MKKRAPLLFTISLVIIDAIATGLPFMPAISFGFGQTMKTSCLSIAMLGWRWCMSPLF
jgi:hypothetical protein